MLLYHKAKYNWSSIIKIASVVLKSIYKQYFHSNTQNFEFLMKLKPCIILKLFLNYSKISAILNLNILIDFIPVQSVYRICMFGSVANYLGYFMISVLKLSKSFLGKIF